MKVYREVIAGWILLSGHLNMYANTTMKHSSLTLTDVLKKATAVTGRNYPRSRKGAKGAYLDIREKIRDAEPIEREARYPKTASDNFATPMKIDRSTMWGIGDA